VTRPGQDPICPPAAGRPEQLCRLVADALGDGDLDAACSYYEPDALVRGPDAAPARGRAQIARNLAAAINSKLAFEIRVHRVLPADSIALMAGTWTARGTDAAGGAVQRAGTVCSVARRGADGAWRVLIEDLDILDGRD
jgi:ketosteroid isomerase-like protein